MGWDIRRPDNRRLPRRRHGARAPHLFALDQADVTAVCAAMDMGGELQRRFPALPIARARPCARMITGPWPKDEAGAKPAPLPYASRAAARFRAGLGAAGLTGSAGAGSADNDLGGLKPKKSDIASPQIGSSVSAGAAGGSGFFAILPMGWRPFPVWTAAYGTSRPSCRWISTEQMPGRPSRVRPSHQRQRDGQEADREPAREDCPGLIAGLQADPRSSGKTQRGKPCADGEGDVRRATGGGSSVCDWRLRGSGACWPQHGSGRTNVMNFPHLRIPTRADAVHCALVLRETLHELASHEAADLGAVVESYRAGRPLTASGLERARAACQRVLC